jgi:hypothetical protein
VLHCLTAWSRLLLQKTISGHVVNVSQILFLRSGKHIGHRMGAERNINTSGGLQFLRVLDTEDQSGICDSS